jgi:hypothetical protein
MHGWAHGPKNLHTGMFIHVIPERCSVCVCVWLSIYIRIYIHTCIHTYIYTYPITRLRAGQACSKQSSSTWPWKAWWTNLKARANNCRCLYQPCGCVCIGTYMSLVGGCVYAYYCHSHNNWGPRNSFQRLLVPVYYWKPLERPETDPQLLWEWQEYILCKTMLMHIMWGNTWCMLCSFQVLEKMEADLAIAKQWLG